MKYGIGGGGADAKALVCSVCADVVKRVKRGCIGVVGEAVGGA